MFETLRTANIIYIYTYICSFSDFQGSVDFFQYIFEAHFLFDMMWYWYITHVAFPDPKEHVEIHALQEELAQRDAELKALRTDLAAAYAKLKDDFVGISEGL